jgi:hypothetical protein
MFKKTLSIAVVAILVLSMGVTLAFAATLDSEEEVLKHQADAKDGQIVGSVPADGMTSEEIDMLDRNFDLQEMQARKDDDIVSNIIFKITKDKGMKSKASNVAKDGRVEVMRYIISYIEAGNEKNLNTAEMARLASYAQSYGPYSDDATILEYLSRQGENTRALSYTYYASDAVNYAHTYAGSYNMPTYPGFEHADCANFVSQALKAREKSTDGQWFIIRRNTTYTWFTDPLNVTQLNYSWMLADPSPWISTKEFNNYWSNRRYGYTYTATGAYVYSHPSEVFGQPYYTSDVVQILAKVYWRYDAFHTMMITGYGNGDYLLSYHTNPGYDNPLHTIASSYNSDSYQFKFFRMGQ